VSDLPKSVGSRLEGKLFYGTLCTNPVRSQRSLSVILLADDAEKDKAVYVQMYNAISFEISVPPHTTAKDVKIVLLPGNQTFLMKIGSQPEETNQFNAKATYLCWQMSDDGNTVC